MYVLSRTIFKLSWHVGQILAFDRVPILNSLIRGEPWTYNCEIWPRNTGNITALHGAEHIEPFSHESPCDRETDRWTDRIVIAIACV